MLSAIPIRILLLFIFFLVYLSVMGQVYKAAVGVRFGYGWGATAKGQVGHGRQNGHFIEGMIRYGNQGVIISDPGLNIGALYEKHFGLGRTKNWSVVLGAGPCMGFGKTNSVKTFSFGIGPIFGFDVCARRLPFNFTIDYKPTFYTDKIIKSELINTSVTYYEIGFSVRYAFKN